MIHQKTECLTSDPQCMCGNFYNVVILNLTQFQVATTASLRFTDWYKNPNWNWELQT